MDLNTPLSGKSEQKPSTPDEPQPTVIWADEAYKVKSLEELIPPLPSGLPPRVLKYSLLRKRRSGFIEEKKKEAVVGLIMVASGFIGVALSGGNGVAGFLIFVFAYGALSLLYLRYKGEASFGNVREFAATSIAAGIFFASLAPATLGLVILTMGLQEFEFSFILFGAIACAVSLWIGVKLAGLSVQLICPSMVKKRPARSSEGKDVSSENTF